MDAHPITHVGPFRTHGHASWLFPCAVLLLGAALLGYLWLGAVSAFSITMTCSMETMNALSLAAALGLGAGCLGATAFEALFAKLLTIAVVTVLAGVLGLVIVELIYGPHCRSS